MEKVIDAAMTIAFVILTAFGGSCGAKRAVSWVRNAALAKVTEGLPPLSPFTKRLTDKR